MNKKLKRGTKMKVLSSSTEVSNYIRFVSRQQCCSTCGTYMVLVFMEVMARLLERTCRSSEDGKVTNVTPVSLLEVKVERYIKVIFGDETAAKKYDPVEMSQIPRVRLGEGTLGALFKVVLNGGSTVTMRKIRPGLACSNDLELWIKYFGGLCDVWLLKIEFSLWYGGEAFVLYEYLCLGSLEELLHGSEGAQFTPLNWEIRWGIALCTAKAVASIHTHITKHGDSLVCGVIKSSNILIRTDFSACLSGYEIPYLVPARTIIRRNPRRVAPELLSSHSCSPMFTKKSDVYSFGVLLLELITGEKPSVTNLAEYVREKKKKEGWTGVFDKKLGNVTDNMHKMYVIAKRCLSYNPNERPPMKRVVQEIQELK
ncbi:hypothetical protein AAG906_037639 [Vitis piasezkii]